MPVDDNGLSVDIEIDRDPETNEVHDALLAAASGALKGVADHINNRLQERREGRKFKFKLNTPHRNINSEKAEPDTD